MKTIKEYKKAILKKYEEGGIEYLVQLSPAKIRADCLLKFQNGLNNKDLIQFIHFFGLEEEASYLQNIRKIENFDIDKFRPFKNFLNRITEDTLDKNIELIAVLIDFEPRPYSNFRKQNGLFRVKKNKSTQKEKAFNNDSLSGEQDKPKERLRDKSKNSESVFSNKNFLVTLGMFLAIYLLLITAKYLFANKSSPDKEDTRFMIWTGEAYKEAPEHVLTSLENYNKIALFEESKVLNFRKVEVTEGYPFFTEQEEPNLWYGKSSDNEIEFFSAPGEHPITGKELKAITPYIIEKYFALV